MELNEASSPAPIPVAPTRPLHWSIKRELWENRSIYLAPLITAGVILIGCLITAFRMPPLRHAALLLEPLRQRAAIEAPYDMAALMVMFVAFIVSIFYCLDALHGERRDRSILFWKSLPVSDFTALLSKALIALVILPLVTFVTIIGMHLVMLLMTTLALLPAGLAHTTFAVLPILRLWEILIYGFLIDAFWQAPVIGWLLLVSGWVRRGTFLWAVLPWIALCMLEKIVFDTTHFAQMLGRRLFGGFEQAFVIVHPPKGTHMSIVDRLAELDPLKFLTSAELWIGLIVAAAFFLGAIRLRRSQGPL